MKISLEWLNAHLEPSVGAEEVEAVLPRLGFPIETSVEGAGADRMFDVEVTSNRGDCLSHVGLAREVAAGRADVFGGDAGLRLPVAGDTPVAEGAVADTANLHVDVPEACPFYTARVIRGVRVGPSPDWMVRRLEAVGLRSVNNVVDVTNYVLHERGQPLHAFDLACLEGAKIVVRYAETGETFTAIDGSHHLLRPSNLVIADARRPMAVAGVMGGLESEVGDKTTDILLESAIFDPLSVRRTSRALKLASDSSFRFERGVDPLGVDAASRRAMELICTLAGGHPAEGVLMAGAPDAAIRHVTMRIRQCRRLLGVDLAAEAIVDMLARLELTPMLEEDGAVVRCVIPTFRLDLRREIDLVEEVVRLYGMERIGVRSRIAVEVRPVQARIVARRIIASTLVGHGFHEAITFTFVSPSQGKPFLDPDSAAIEVDEACRRVGTRAEPMLRPSLVPSLLNCRKSNQDVGNSQVRLYEMAATWQRCEGQVNEARRLALLLDVDGGEGDATACEAALRSVRGAVDAIVQRLGGAEAVAVTPVEESGYEVAADVAVAQVRLGTLGAVDAATRDRFGLQSPVVAAELDLDALLGFYPSAPAVSALPRFPAIERDLSIVVDESIRWRQIEQVVAGVGATWFESLLYLTVYRGRQVPKGRKSVSLRMVFRDPLQTLRHEAVDGEVKKVIAALAGALGAVLR